MMCNGVKIIFICEDDYYCEETQKRREYVIVHVFDTEHIRRCWYWKDTFDPTVAIREFKEIAVGSNNKYTQKDWIEQHGSLT